MKTSNSEGQISLARKNKEDSPMKRILPILDQMALSLGGLATNIVLARVLGMNDYGYFVILWTIITLGVSVTQAITTTPMLTYLPASSTKTEEIDYIKSGVIQVLAACAILIIVSFFAVEINNIIGQTAPAEILKGIKFGITGVLPVALHDFFRRVAIARKNELQALVIDGLYLASTAIGLTLIAMTDSNGHSPEIAFLLIISAYVPSCIAGVILTRSAESTSNFPLMHGMRHNWEMARWLLPATLIQWPTTNLFVLSVASISGPAAAGGMRIAQTLVGPLNILYSMIESRLPVGLAVVDRTSRAQVKDAIARIAQGLLVPMLIVVAILLTICLLSEKLLTIVFSQNSIQLRQMVFGYSVVYILVFLVIPARVLTRAMQISKYILLSQGAALLFAAICSAAMVKQIGPLGGVIGLAAAQLISLLSLAFGIWNSTKNANRT